ncbi:unnamed protein product [Vitrella brassicaformis CCMP3155]|uniref:Uncharacterized protein n=1 Tax=Vitrella brassicaformis (strain CCMP3155) TaxID=1169540 RepID=A0A0G4FGJ2_VITBC|nr:unnamed protein product [Vitrella brassicaformis CCMP3155]|eukprot:CEM12461.1 unnamed protein product [Vitrella brassicaformis CCMP3155]
MASLCRRGGPINHAREAHWRPSEWTGEWEYWQPYEDCQRRGLWIVRSATQDLTMRSWAVVTDVMEGVEKIGTGIANAIAGLFGQSLRTFYIRRPLFSTFRVGCLVGPARDSRCRSRVTMCVGVPA